MESKEVLYHRHLIIGIITFIEILGLTSYALRLLARRLSMTKLWHDDYVMGIGWIAASIPGICYYIALQYGLGQHAKQVSEKDMEKFLICNFIFQLCWAATFPIVKIAVLIFYSRLFPGKPFRWVIYGTGVFLSLILVCGLFGMILQCRPIHSSWQPGVEHSCFNQLDFYIAMGSLNLVTDVFVVLMPIPILWGLHLPPARKSGLVAIFLLAGVACAVSLRRVISLTELDEADITWSHVGPGLWSAVEGEVLVVSANFPLMGPVVQQLGAKYRSLSNRDPQDEESKNVLELSATGSSSKGAMFRGTSQRTQDATFETFAVGTPKKSKSVAFTENEIHVEMNLEQRVHDL